MGREEEMSNIYNLVSATNRMKLLSLKSKNMCIQTHCGIKEQNECEKNTVGLYNRSVCRQIPITRKQKVFGHKNIKANKLPNQKLETHWSK